jgi:cysteine-rich repeat protein
MKNKILFLTIAAIGALLITASNGFAYPDRCPIPAGNSCSGCHATPGTNGWPACPAPPPACTDNDGDGYGNPGDSSCRSGSARDCNDNNASINPGAAENCTDGVDNNCNNLVDAQDPNALNCPIVCNDADFDGYDENCSPVDCDGTDPNINPGAFEVCDDGVDNDCNGRTDCDDSACSGDPACVSTPPAPPTSDPFCGDGNIDAGEQCDDGNAVSGDGCSSTCQTEYTAPPSNEEEEEEEEEEYRRSRSDDDRYESRERERNHRRSYRDRD